MLGYLHRVSTINKNASRLVTARVIWSTALNRFRPAPALLASSVVHQRRNTSTSAAAAASTDTTDPDVTAETERLVSGVLSGDRIALSRAITLIESNRSDHRRQSADVMRRVLSATAAAAGGTAPAPGTPPRSIRIGISGPPGVGKSTFIESFGMYLVGLGHRVAVLSIDPSSTRTGGSILGDKTRMINLSRHPSAYVRPSPSRGTLGGVAADTSESVVLCESGGFDVVLVETVGVGQSEVSVRDCCDMVMLLVSPGGGDELQGMKKGIVEIADLIVVNKADTAMLSVARDTKVEYAHALALNRRSYPGGVQWTPPVRLCSSLESQSAFTPEQSAAAAPPSASVAAAAELHLKPIWTDVQKFRKAMAVCAVMSDASLCRCRFDDDVMVCCGAE